MRLKESWNRKGDGLAFPDKKTLRLGLSLPCKRPVWGGIPKRKLRMKTAQWGVEISNANDII